MSNHAFAAPILPASVKTVTPTFNRIPEVKPSTNFETAKKPVVVESNIGNTRIKDNGSNLAPTTVSQTFFFQFCNLWAIHGMLSRIHQLSSRSKKTYPKVFCRFVLNTWKTKQNIQLWCVVLKSWKLFCFIFTNFYMDAYWRYNS